MKNLLSVRQVAFILKVHPLTVRRYITSGKLKAVRVGGNVRITEDSLTSLNQEVTIQPKDKIFKPLKRSLVFDSSDPLFRLEGRGASLSGGLYE